MQANNIAVLGAGAWGTALAQHLASSGHNVLLWDRNQNLINDLNKTRRHPKFYNIVLHPNINFITSLNTTISQSRYLVIAITSTGFVELLEQIKSAQKIIKILWVCKGLAVDGEFLQHKVQQILPSADYGVLSGPSFADELIQHKPTFVDVACSSNIFAQQIKQDFNTQSLHINLSNDLIGVQLGGIVKNIIAIAVGLSDGFKLGSNAKSAILTKAMHEIANLLSCLHGEQQTMLSYAIFGDLTLTCNDDKSRNRKLGLLLANNFNLDQAQTEIGHMPEGLFAAKTVHDLANKHNLSMPVCQAVYNILYKKHNAITEIKSLLA